MKGIDTIYTSLDRAKSDEREYQEEQEAYDRGEERLAGQIGVSPEYVVKAERTDLDEGDSVLYVEEGNSIEAFVVEKPVPNSRMEEVAIAFGTYREGRASAPAGVYNGEIADVVAALEGADIAVGSDGQIQRRDESTVVDLDSDSTLEPRSASRDGVVQRALEQDEGEKGRATV